MRHPTKPRKLYDVYYDDKYLFTANLDDAAVHMQMSKIAAKNYVNSDIHNPDAKWLLLPVEGSDRTVYAFYSGEKLLAVGNREEVAEELGVSPQYIMAMASNKLSKEGKRLGKRYAVALTATEAEKLHAENAQLEGFRIFTSSKGTPRNTYEFYKHGKLIATGNLDEISKASGLSESYISCLATKTSTSDKYKVNNLGKYDDRTYVVYSGNYEIRAIGTKEEVLEKLNIKESTLNVFMSINKSNQPRPYVVAMD